MTSPESSASNDAAAEHKTRRGLRRLLHATGYSLQGLAAAWEEKAFRLEVTWAVVLLPAAFVLGRGWVEVAVLAGSVLAVLVVELLNTAVEAVVDRVGPEWHLLAKKAKDIGSAAVLLSVLFCAAVWIAALAHRLGG
ncbi:diacylglycerol kinase [Xylophilus sp. ASV27]|uniref:diacylglycerol kinase n=1 Tax=Xylophilus sp. ASV27 TaxID=2795129 RepID=UPI0018EE06BE|nr:diacylglycerol kinase [Xylophilus sp. ASV27]